MIFLLFYDLLYSLAHCLSLKQANWLEMTNGSPLHFLIDSISYKSLSLFNPLTTLEWLRQNFSLQCQYNINQISDENKEKYQFEENKLIQY